MATKYQEKLEEMRAKTVAAHRIVEEKPNLDWTIEEVEKFQTDQKDLERIGKELEPLKAIHDAAEAQKQWLQGFRTAVDPIGFDMSGGALKEGNGDYELKTLGEIFTSTEEYKAHRSESNPHFGYDVGQHTARTQQKASEQKATITTTAGFAPFIPRQARVQEYAIRRTVVADLMPNTNITAPSVSYMEETTFTNAAAPVAEDGTKQPSTIVWTARNVPVEVIAHYVVITEQQLEDVPQMQSTIDNRLTVMLMLAEEGQLMNGNGTSPQLDGFYHKAGQTQSGSGLEPVDAIYKAFTKIRATAFAEPDGVVIHPSDWEAIRLMRADGATGVYLFGSPSEAGPETIWGKKAVVTTAATENTALVGDFGLYSELFRKMGIRIEVGRINDDLIKNRLTVRAEERVTLVVYRTTAFCTVTNI